MNKMVFDELYGEIPVYLHKAIKAHKVTQSEFFLMEDQGMDHRGMWAHIKRNLVDNRYREPLFSFVFLAD